MTGAVGVLFSLSLVQAAEPAVGSSRVDSFYWERLPQPPDGVRAAVSFEDHPTVLGQSGALHQWTNGGWTLRASPALDEPVPNRMALLSDGALWVWSWMDAWARQYQDGWLPRQMLPAGLVHVIDRAPDGTLWAAGLHGYLARRSQDGWARVPGVPLDRSVESNLWSLTFDGQGTVWVGGYAGLLLRLDDSGARRLHFPQIIERTNVVLDPSGRPVLLGEPPQRLDVDGFPALEDPALLRGATPGRPVLYSDGDSLHRIGADGQLNAIVAPVQDVPVSYRSAPDGATVAVAGGQLYVLRRGRVPTLVDVAGDWGVTGLTDDGAVWVADFDGDGRDDLLLRGELRGLRLLLQRSDSFVDVSSRWGLNFADLIGDLAVCDLDGDGRADIVGRVDSEGPHTLRYLRTRRGRFEDVTDFGFSPLPEPLSGSGLATCADVDDDGDLDILFAPGGREGLADGAKVRLLENIGYGHLHAVPLAARGLGLANAWSRQVLVDDLDGDDLVDFVSLNLWNRGHTLLQGRPGQRVVDVTEGSGVNALYGLPSRGWIARIDDDEHPDLLVLEDESGLRAWKGAPDLRLRERSQAWGLGVQVSARSRSFGSRQGILDDLNRDGRPDVVVGSVLGGSSLLLGSASGRFERIAGVLPDTPVVALATLDLSGDGDRDLLIIGQGADHLLENRDPDPARAGSGRAVNSAIPAASVARRLAWLRPLDAALAVLWLLPWSLAAAATRLEGSRLLLGRIGPLAPLAAITSWGALLEFSALARGLAAALGAAAAGAAAAAEIGLDRRRKARRVAGYRLLEKLGAGAMGTVYRAVDVQSGQLVALKLVNPELLAAEADRLLFRREARLGSSLVDPRVVRIFAFGEWTVVEAGIPRPTAYLAMELLEGTTLRHVLLERGRLPIGPACAIVRELALALSAVHERGIVHRDIKPENAMLVPGGVKLMDFGAARPIGQRTQSTKQVLGTLGYLAPEQGQGRPPDVRSDVYALGVVLFELISGRRPFEADDLVQLLSRLISEPAPPLSDTVPDIPPMLEALVLKALSKEPGDRFPSAQALADALTPLCSVVPVPSRSGAPRHSPGEGATQGSQLSLLGRLLSAWWHGARRDESADPRAFALSMLAREVGQTDPVLASRIHEIRETITIDLAEQTYHFDAPHTDSPDYEAPDFEAPDFEAPHSNASEDPE